MSEQVPPLGQVLGLEANDDVPAELGYLVGQAPVVIVWSGAGEAPDEVEADAPDAGRVQVS
jgi:hypothetical protein